MRISGGRLVPWMTLLFLVGCGMEPSSDELEDPGDEPSPSESVSGLEIRLGSETAYDVDQTPWVDVTYVNRSAQPLRVLSWAMPSDTLWENLFSVTVDGQPVRYIGRVYKRPDPTEKDIVSIAPGQSVSGRVDLSRLYDLSRAGHYEVRVNAREDQIIGVSAGNDAIVASNAVRMATAGHRLPARPGDVSTYYYGLSYVQCSSAQKRDLVIGMRRADEFAADATSYLASPDDGRARYVRWFGRYSSSRYATVKRNFQTLKQRQDTKRITFHCDCNEDYYAYVYPDQPYNIYICNIYWDASLDDMGGTVTHEMSHFYAVAGTDDVTYGASSCQQLARSNPSSAIRNADNYAYFVELP